MLSIKIPEEARSHWRCWRKSEISNFRIFYFRLSAFDLSPAVRDVRFDKFRTVLADVLPQNWSWRRNKRDAVSLCVVVMLFVDRLKISWELSAVLGKYSWNETRC